jgi:uncharacterized protein (TIGR02757 family)
MPAIQANLLAETLERLYARYNHRRYIGSDPLQFAHRFTDSRDIEIAAFLAASLAYGRVQQIERSVNRLLSLMEASPHAFVACFEASNRAKLAGFRHRFTSGETLADLLELLRIVLDEHGSLEACFAAGYDPGELNVVPALTRFCDRLSDLYARGHGGRRPGRELMYLLASPRRGSASKRLHLFLRWMVRSDAVDVGLWSRIDKAGLIVPMDVHMGRLCRILGLHASRTISLATAVQVTEGFARIEPTDPVKYDFALSRIGIVENCDGHCRTACEACELLDICAQRENWRR